MHFDLIDIRLFVNIAEKASLTQGAERSNMSPPAASIRIKNIEERLGTKLLHRTSHGVSPTPAGQAFIHHGRLVLQQLEHLRRDLLAWAEEGKGRVRIFANPGAVNEVMPSVLSAYLTTHSDINVELRERTTSEIVRAVTDGTADIGIVEGKVPGHELQTLPYCSERLVLATSRAHELARSRQISFEDTLGYDYVALLDGNPIQGLLNQAAMAAQRPLKTRAQVGTFESLCRMVETGVGIGILPEGSARRHAKTIAIHLVDLTDDWATRQLHACVRNLETLPPSVRDLVNLLMADGAAVEQMKERAAGMSF